LAGIAILIGLDTFPFRQDLNASGRWNHCAPIEIAHLRWNAHSLS
jgi:hypothetical protein